MFEKTGSQIVIDARKEDNVYLYLDREANPMAPLRMDLSNLEFLKRTGSLNDAIQWANTYIALNNVIFGIRFLLDEAPDVFVQEVEEFLKTQPPMEGGAAT